ncbi:MAG: hypothetical protein ABWW65_00840, partial [Thermoprotei archaeon]
MLTDVSWGSEMCIRDSLLFYIDRSRVVIINVAPTVYCLPNFTTFKYNGTYIELIRPRTPEDKKY